jgi:hypothetical protein
MYGSSFINDDWIGNKILSNLLEACNVSTYISNGVPVEVPFVPCNQMYIAGDIHTVNGINLIMNEVIL